MPELVTSRDGTPTAYRRLGTGPPKHERTEGDVGAGIEVHEHAASVQGDGNDLTATRSKGTAALPCFRPS